MFHIPYTTPIQPAVMATQGFMQGGIPAFGQAAAAAAPTVGKSGGFLAKLLGGSQAGGGMTSLLNILQNAQKAVGAVQTVAPMVQQYYPIVKSIPAMIAMMKSNDDDTSNQKEESIDNTNLENTEKVEIAEENELTNKNKKNLHLLTNKEKQNQKRKAKQP
ncbi:MAG: YqfQ family protein, partial [Bacillaceae bacterium]|nr:YqfQ family protein [Bacillaceae bacterium]